MMLLSLCILIAGLRLILVSAFMLSASKRLQFNLKADAYLNSILNKRDLDCVVQFFNN
jgi:hypothetical protein